MKSATDKAWLENLERLARAAYSDDKNELNGWTDEEAVERLIEPYKADIRRIEAKYKARGCPASDENHQRFGGGSLGRHR